MSSSAPQHGRQVRPEEAEQAVQSMDAPKRSLSRMIGLGFAGVLVLHLMVAILSHVGLSRATGREKQMHQEQAILSSALRNDRDIAELQRDALSFMFTGSSRLAVQVNDDCKVLATHLQSFSTSLGSRSYQGVTASMITALANYPDGFRKVVEDRDQRDRLLETSVRPFSMNLREDLTAIMNEARSSGTNQQALLAADALMDLTESGESIDRYIASPNSTHARRFEKNYASLASDLAALKGKDAPIADDLERWRSDVLGVINRTRSFLHLVNVVLSGEALEFRTLSAELSSTMLAEQERLAAESFAAQTKFTKASTAFGILTIIVGVLAGLWIGRSVSTPIVSITETFSNLARGKEAKIDGLNRRDEIGEMARAAEVFALRNRETRELLTRATELGETQAATNASLLDHVKELRQKNEDLDSFCYSASHDLKSPLRSISLLANWIEEDEANELSQESADFLQTLQSRSVRLQGLLSGLLEYSRVGRSQNLSETFDALELVQETVDALSGAGLATFKVDGTSSHMFAPLVAVQTCIQKLVDNSIKHSDQATPKVTVEVRPDNKGNTTLTVNDDGPGIPPALHHKIMEIFQTVRRRDEHESSGVGLAIVQRLVENHSASLEVKSDGLRGCSISIRWPNGTPRETLGHPSGSSPSALTAAKSLTTTSNLKNPRTTQSAASSLLATS